MKKCKNRIDFLEILKIKLAASIILITIVFSTLFVVPTHVFSEDIASDLAMSLAVRTEENMILYSYKVYSTQERFENGLKEDVGDVLKVFKERNEVLAVAINGQSLSITVDEEFIFVTSPDVPQLNIEYRLVKDLKIENTTLTIRTFIGFLKELFFLINTIFYTLYIIIFFLITILALVKTVRFYLMIKNYSKPFLV
jgi:hypothetical protein